MAAGDVKKKVRELPVERVSQYFLEIERIPGKRRGV
jgi:hypothetical protein